MHLRNPKNNCAYMYFVRYLRDKFGLIDVNSVEELTYFVDKPINSILIPYSFRYLDNIKAKVEFIREILRKYPDVKIIRFFNEYNVPENSDLRKIFTERPYDLLLTNFERDVNKFNYKNRLTLNVNCLSFFDFHRSFRNVKKYDLIYYGSFRENRKRYFLKYLKDNECVIISCSLRALDRFKNLLGNAKYIDTIKNLGKLSCPLKYFRYGLYIEDTITHKNYNFPANRFYEQLSYEVVQFFDVNCLNTFNRYGLDIADFIVTDKEDLIRKVKTSNYFELWEKQRRWREKAVEDFRILDKQVEKHLSPYFA